MNDISSDNIPVGPRCNIYNIYLGTGVTSSPSLSAPVSHFHNPFISSAVMLKRRGTVSLQLTAYTNARTHCANAHIEQQEPGLNSLKKIMYIFF